MLDDDGYFSPKLLPSMDDGDEEFELEDDSSNVGDDDVSRFFRAFGLFWRICLAWDVSAILEFSPFFALFLLTKDVSVCLEDDVLYSLAPALHRRLHTWPPQRLASGGWDFEAMKDPYLLCLDVMPNCEVRRDHVLPDTSYSLILQLVLGQQYDSSLRRQDCQYRKTSAWDYDLRLRVQVTSP